MSVKFQYGTQADYDSLENFDSTCIYFITDTQRIYRGDTLYASGIQDKLTAGENITIENNVISLADDFIAEVEKKTDKTYVDGELAKKQNNLTAGAGISINEDNVISTSANFQVEIVGLDEQGLPSVNEPSSQVLYLTHSTQTEVSDVYNEWLWIYDTEIESFRWEKIGSTQVDLSGYAQKSELPTKTSDLTNDSDFVSDVNYIHTDNNFTADEKKKLGSLANYDDTTIKEQIAKKQDKLSKAQLENISAVPNKIDKSQVGNGLKFENGQLQLDIPVASASTTYGGGDA